MHTPLLFLCPFETCHSLLTELLDLLIYITFDFNVFWFYKSLYCLQFNINVVLRGCFFIWLSITPFQEIFCLAPLAVVWYAIYEPRKVYMSLYLFSDGHKLKPPVTRLEQYEEMQCSALITTKQMRLIRLLVDVVKLSLSEMQFLV